MDKATLKTAEEITIMTEVGRLLGEIRKKTAEAVRPGMTTAELDRIADELIAKTGGEASFKLVKGYKHATCINVNEVVVHGIPGSDVLKEGDIVGIDVGLYLKGFHADTAVTVPVGKVDAATNAFLETGREAVNKAIKEARPGKRIADLSAAMQQTVEKKGYSAVTALTGHGIGRNLHEEPSIPCFMVGKYEHSPLIVAGMVLAIEVMYNMGTSEVVYKNRDGWTIITADDKISGLFEHTVAVTDTGPVVLT